MHARALAPIPALALTLGLGSALPAGAACPSGNPLLSGPSIVQTGQSYSLSWTPVLETTGVNDYYLVQRSADPSFAGTIDQIRTTRPAQTLPAVATQSTVLYHRVVVYSSCPSAGPAPVVSNVLTVTLTSDCETPGSAGEIAVTPSDPPAFATYILTWAEGVGGPGPGGAPQNVTYHLRRTTPDGRVFDSISSMGKASFADPPGEYVYEVRAEASCGTVGPWSTPKIVRVGTRPIASLAVVNQPAPIAAVAPASPASTQFTVRNTSTLPLQIAAAPKDLDFTVTPSSFTVDPFESRTLTVSYKVLGPTSRAVHTTVELTSGDASLSVPIDAGISQTAADAPAVWSDADVDIDANGGGVLRSIVNTSAKPVTLVTSVNKPWLVVETLDGSPWDETLYPGETRVLRIRVDRTRRQAETGTEIAAATLVTVGQAEKPQVLQVVDDGPPLYVENGPRPDLAGEKTRMLYASVPNALDITKTGRYASDLWLSNLDPVNAIDVTLLLTPVGVDSRNLTYRFTTKLQPSETRRYRNIVKNMLRTDAACELEVRSPAPSLSATALINNTPLAALAAKKKLSPLATTPPNGQYGFEMRPTQPGEGVRVDDQTFYVTGLMHNAARRTNMLFTETSGYSTTVRVSIYDRAGVEITRGGGPVTRTVLPLSTLQLYDETDLFADGTSYPGSVYAKVEWVTATIDGFGKYHGSVVPFATVIDQTTQDASLRVGVSSSALDPNGPATSTAARTALAGTASLPFGGGPAPLLFPAAHLLGAPLGNGVLPYWRTRVTFTNTTDPRTGQDRAVLLSYHGSDQGPQDSPRTLRFALPAGSTFTIDDILGSQLGFAIPESVGSYGPVTYQVAADGEFTWKDVDVATETYTLDPNDTSAARGQYATGMEGFSYHHGYSSFQSNLGTVQIEGAENSSRYRTNLILQEVGGAACTVALSIYLNGSFVPVATKGISLPPFGYLSDELFRGWLGLDLNEVTDVRVVVRQIDGQGVFMAFASRIDRTTGDPANVFLRPASAGTGR